MVFKKKTRASYTASLKLKVIERAKETNNIVAAKEFGISEKLVRDWRKNEAKLRVMPKSKKALRFKATAFDGMERDLNDWIVERRQDGRAVTRASIRTRALQMAKEKYSATAGMERFKASAGWCIRFMNRYGLCLRQGTKILHRLPKELDEKELSILFMDESNSTSARTVDNGDVLPVSRSEPKSESDDVGGDEEYYSDIDISLPDIKQECAEYSRNADRHIGERSESPISASFTDAELLLTLKCEPGSSAESDDGGERDPSPYAELDISYPRVKQEGLEYVVNGIHDNDSFITRYDSADSTESLNSFGEYGYESPRLPELSHTLRNEHSSKTSRREINHPIKTSHGCHNRCITVAKSHPTRNWV